MSIKLFIRGTNEICNAKVSEIEERQMKLSWSKFGEVLSWLGIIYFVGFLLFGLVTTLVLLPRYESIYGSSGQSGIFNRIVEMVGPLTALFLIISAASWYQGRELTTEESTTYDRVVAVALFIAVVFILTPQLFMAVTSLIPAIRP